MVDFTRSGLPRAHRYETFECTDPHCGPHIVAFDRDDVPMCEIVLSQDMTRGLIKALQGLLYNKAVDKDPT